MINIYLVRHGQSEANAGGPIKPNAEIQLTDLGRQQAQEVCQWLTSTLKDDICSIGISRFIRTLQTAEPLIKQTKIQPTIIEGLHEFDYLDINKMQSTMPMSERIRAATEFWQTFEPTQKDGKDTESFANFSERVRNVLSYFYTLQSGNHVVYTHGIWISMLIWQLLNQPIDSQIAMQNFRKFETAIRARNCEAFLLTLGKSCPPAITKVYIRQDDSPTISY